ncbi:elongation factor P maturation arginine rhamnosyltransferase EarP [Neisseria sp. Dent CA1/247]|uniref:elongation factor P maturation arginine rhamnosyltransferase EarP n=1 Tax=Neisseria sp. Dent CA1/247 TaxID=2912675 RepID=UPI001FD3E52A|nr:elongation factor P maturation arginine rhamnosyltransferase EarP [Neisseria sp. Dent CA1/247]UOO75964.1 elongation factor P maturation arginine rhamnosyltransferase EarP [Neisseria sp. Dent CA1/247]
MPSENTSPKICWLFCNVIDNFGDIGVSWRLAKMLTRELGWQVHLWVDDTAALRALCPDLPATPCTHQHITVRAWQAERADGLDNAPPPHIVIETFACDLPPDVSAVIRRQRPLWLNWEYLSAEDSNEKLHALPSPQADGLQKYFWFMGFSERSGGLLREQDYETHCRFDEHTLRQTLKLPTKTTPEWLLFGYHSPVWAEWFVMWQQAEQPLTLLLAGNPIIDSLKKAGAIPPHALNSDGSIFQTASVRLVKIPFIPQSGFDRLLHLSDGLIIRGEDSFVRAQFAAKPFLWHIYPQEESVHIDKLHAFWHKAYTHYPDNIQTAHQALSDELNGARSLTPAQRLEAWQTLQRHADEWRQSVADWKNTLFKQPSAIEKLAKFIEHR